MHGDRKPGVEGGDRVRQRASPSLAEPILTTSASMHRGYPSCHGELRFIGVTTCSSMNRLSFRLAARRHDERLPNGETGGVLIGTLTLNKVAYVVSALPSTR